MATPAQLTETKNLFGIAYPAKAPFDQWLSDSLVGPWIDAGFSPQQIADGVIKGMRALNFKVDPSGQWQGARSQAFGGHYPLQDVLGMYFTKEKDTFPSDAYIRGFVLQGQPSVNWDGTPATATPPKPKPEPGKPPVETPPDGGLLSALKEWATNRFTANEVRISTLESDNATLKTRVRGIREKLGIPEEGDGTPGGR